MSIKVLYDMLSVTCSYCGARRGDNCSTTSGPLKYKQHASRINDYHEENNRIARKELT